MRSDAVVRCCFSVEIKRVEEKHTHAMLSEMSRTTRRSLRTVDTDALNLPTRHAVDRRQGRINVAPYGYLRTRVHNENIIIRRYDPTRAMALFNFVARRT